MSITNPATNSTTNYLVPAGGTTHAVTFNGVYSATPTPIDWRQFTIDNFPFQPQGVFIDNTQGTGPLTITIKPINFSITCAAGVSTQAQFPAPNGQTCTITGNGQATLVFVDFPVLPSSGVVSIANTVSVDLVSNAANLTVGVVPTQNSSGLPYQVREVPIAAVADYSSITGTATSATITPPASSNLRKLVLALSENATLATAGTDLLTVTLNGVVVYQQNIYIPAALGAQLIFDALTLDFAKLGLNAGASGTLVVSLATALATGILDINAYFD